MNTPSSFRLQLSSLVHSLSWVSSCRIIHPRSSIWRSCIVLIWVLMFAARGASAQTSWKATLPIVLSPSQYEAVVSIYGAANGPAWTNQSFWLNPDEYLWEGLVATGWEVTSAPPYVVTEFGYVLHLNRDNINASGSLSGSIGNLTRLESLYFGSNQLSGSIPTSLGSCSSLQYLGLGDNQFTGSIPTSLGNLTSLITLDLNQNQLSGAIPSSLGNLVNLRELWLPDNQLTGSIPATLSGMQQLQIFSVSLNQLAGSIPAFLGSLTQLVRLELNDNLLTGTIPAELGALTQLQMLFIDGNQLTGQIPAALGNLASLEELFLSANQLTGAIPASLGGLTNLIGLGVEGNQLSGSIPAQLGGLNSLEELALEHNQLAGRVPQAVLDLPLLTYFTVHNNYITLDTEQRAAFIAAGWSAGSYEPQKEPALAFTPVTGGMSGSPLNWEPLTDEPLIAQFSVENLEPGVSSLVVTVESQSPWLHVTATGSSTPAMTATVELSQQGGVADTSVFTLHLDLTSLEIGEIYTGSVKVFAGGRVTTVPVTLSYFDITPPEVTPPGSWVVEATGIYGAAVTYPAATATDNVEVTSITYSHPSGMIFPIGVTTVTVTAKDAADNEGTATFSITVAPANVTMSAANLLMTTTTLILTGSNFSPTPGNNTVAFTPTGTGTVTAATPTSLTVTGLTGFTPGALYAVVTTNSLSSGAPVQVATVVAEPTVSSISPARASSAGGTSVTITGTNLSGATGVTIGGVAASSLSANTATSITCVTPGGTPGAKSVVVTTPGGSNSTNSLFTYVAAPSVTAMTASSLTSMGATLNGTVIPNGFPTTARFEYGLTTSYGTTASVILSPTDGTIVQNVSANISSLTPGTLYHYRLSATHSGGTAVTTDGSFTTLTASQAVNSAIATAGLSGPNAALDATPHHEGVENLLKYAFNMSLSGPDSATMSAGGISGLPGIIAQPNGAASIFRFEFLRRKNSGLIYTPQKSGDLTNPNSWVPLTDAPTVIPIDAAWERVIYEEPYNAATTPLCFGRLQVVLPP